jgi:hypothetical protein
LEGVLAGQGGAATNAQHRAMVRLTGRGATAGSPPEGRKITHVLPNATQAEIIDKIVQLRRPLL